MRRDDERGFAGVVLLALSAVLALVASLAVALGSVAVVRHQAASAADLGALAAADLTHQGPGPACAAAVRVVQAALGSRASVLSCALLGGADQQVEVVVRLRPTGPLGLLGAATATARAGR